MLTAPLDHVLAEFWVVWVNAASVPRRTSAPLPSRPATSVAEMMAVRRLCALDAAVLVRCRSFVMMVPPLSRRVIGRSALDLRNPSPRVTRKARPAPDGSIGPDQRLPAGPDRS